MLQELRVKNLALIDGLHLDFAGTEIGLIVLTGETGAGKSIILQALHLLIGGRASSSWIRSDCDQAVIEAYFDISSDQAGVTHLLSEHALKSDSTCIIRRVLSQQGRSRMYVNDQSVTARLTAELSGNLVNIASQHDQQHLLNTRQHLDFLDSYGELWGLRRQFTKLFQKWQHLSSQLRQLQEKEQDKEQQKAFLQFQLDEIRKVRPEEEEDELLIRERDRLRASATLVELAGTSHRQLTGNILDTLTGIRKKMEQVCELDPDAQALTERIISACFEIEDLEGSLRGYRDSIPMDTSRLDEISARLGALKQLQRKYGPTIEEVLEFSAAAERDLASLESLEEEITALEVQLEKVSTEALLKATELTYSRKEAAQKLGAAMESELDSLSFNQAVFNVAVSEPEGLGMEGIQSTGKDDVEFFFSANPGEAPKPLAKVVSGGELSRLMLAMKCLLARRDQVQTVVFDEVDAGISGQAAEAVAAKISELAGHHQVFCITHLPQIAACADEHFKVEKSVDNGRTSTVIVPLDQEARIVELARMLGGEQPTRQTLAYASELIERKGMRVKQ